MTKGCCKIVKKLRGDGDMCKALLEIMEPEINQIVEERVEKKVEEVREAVTEEAKRKAKKEAMREAKEEAMKEAKKEAKKEAMKEAKKEAISMATKMLKSGKFTAEEILEYIPWLSAEEILHIVSNLQAGPQTKRNG